MLFETYERLQLARCSHARPRPNSLAKSISVPCNSAMHPARVAKLVKDNTKICSSGRRPSSTPVLQAGTHRARKRAPYEHVALQSRHHFLKLRIRSCHIYPPAAAINACAVACIACASYSRRNRLCASGIYGHGRVSEFAGMLAQPLQFLLHQFELRFLVNSWLTNRGRPLPIVCPGFFCSFECGARRLWPRWTSSRLGSR